MTASVEALQASLQRKVPNGKLKVSTLPYASEIKLWLIDENYPQADLSQQQVEELMDNPPYWAFCWASGQVMARYLLDQTSIIAGKEIVDFGCGSGVVAIAAAMAGAKHSIALDIDQIALEVSQLNAELNNTSIEISDSLDKLLVDKSQAILLIADVFYDAENIPLLEGFIKDYADVIIADSRVKPDSLKGVTEVARFESCTVPDLAEASDFNSVGIYRLKHSSK